MRRSLFMTFGALISALAISAGLPLNTSAGANPNPPVPAAKQESSRDVARANAKHALALQLDRWAKGQISTAQFNNDRSAFLSKWGPATFATFLPLPHSGTAMAASASQGLSIPLDPRPGSRSLALTQYPEQNPSQYCQPGTTCYCGPSAAQSVLAYLQPTSHDGEALSQLCLAGTCGPGSPYSWKYLETNVPHGGIPGGETPWYSGSNDYPMPQTFNYWYSGDYFGLPYYTAYRPTSVSDYEALLMSDIWNQGAPGFPLAGDIEEVSNGLHLPGHPGNLEIQHWIAMYGYSGSGYYTHYVDPVAGSALGWSVSAYNTFYPSSNIYTLVTDAGPNGGPYGIVW